MIILGDPAKPSIAKDTERCLDPQLWQACAGGMVQMPQLNSRVYYFLQGHAEHAQGSNLVDLGTCPRLPPLVLCRVAALKFMADPETDEVFAKILLVPIAEDPDSGEEDKGAASLGCNGQEELQDKPASFAKTLTQSDANNGGGFSVPRYCAETIFPRLDYNADPPVQTVLAKDVHGEIWKFRHIYRGTPRRHLLTTGWSAFVNHKKLVAGDSIVFLRTDNGDLCVGIRRAKRIVGGAPEASSGWNPPSAYAGFPSLFKEEEGKFLKGNTYGGGVNLVGKMGTKGSRVRAESVIEAATLAANGQPFEVVYYPRASTPEFCVKAASVRAAIKTQWCPGIRFKMAFETEDSSRISWFMGTISAVQVADPIRWPTSPWRLLQVTWDEPDLLHDVKRVSPWAVELASNMPAIHLAPFSPPPRKKPRVTQQHPEFPLGGHLPTPLLPAHHLGPGIGHHPNLSYLPDGTPSGIQGARHPQFGLSLADLQLNRLQPGLFQSGFHRLNQFAPPPPPRTSAGLVLKDPNVPDDVSCVLTIGSSSRSTKKPNDAKAQQPHFMLFGKPILTKEQMSQSSSGEVASPGVSGNSLSYGNHHHHNKGATADTNTASYEGYAWYRDHQAAEFGLETGQCKVFLDSEDVGRTVDLSSLRSYEELHARLAGMFGVKASEVASRVLYRDSVGAVKHTGDEPFREFVITARRLTILMDSASDNVAR